MNLSAIAVALRSIADALEADTQPVIQPVAPAPVSPPQPQTQAQPPQMQQPVQVAPPAQQQVAPPPQQPAQVAPPAQQQQAAAPGPMSFSDFTAQLRALSQQAGPGALDQTMEALLARYSQPGVGVQGVAQEQYANFLAEAQSAAAQLRGGVQ